MGGDRLRVLVLALGYLAAALPALAVVDWFVIDLGVAAIHIDLRDGRGLYKMFAASAFWGSWVAMMPLVAYQAFTRVTSGVANPKLSRYGIYIGLALLSSGLLAAYVVPPEILGPPELVPQVERTIAPLLFVLANVLGIAALHYAARETVADDVGTYKPVVIDTPVARPITQPPQNRAITQPPQNRAITQPPQNRAITQPPQNRAITQPPINKPITQPPQNQPALSYVVMSAEITRAGIDARRPDGTALLVLWRDVVGIVVRRLPDELEAATFMDIVSVRGATLRIVAWTRLTGVALAGAGDDRVRELAGHIAPLCSDMPLFDPATRAFLESTEPAAQLKDVAKLAAHDERLA